MAIYISITALVVALCSLVCATAALVDVMYLSSRGGRRRAKGGATDDSHPRM